MLLLKAHTHPNSSCLLFSLYFVFNRFIFLYYDSFILRSAVGGVLSMFVIGQMLPAPALSRERAVKTPDYLSELITI